MTSYIFEVVDFNQKKTKLVIDTKYIEDAWQRAISNFAERCEADKIKSIKLIITTR